MVEVNRQSPSPGGALGLQGLEDCLRNLIEKGLVHLITDNRYSKASDVDGVYEVTLEVDGIKASSKFCVPTGK